MLSAETQKKAGAAHLKKRTTLLWIASLAIFFVIAWFSYRTFSSRSVSSAPDVTVISQSKLEETYGLQVYLVAVTAAGGMVDVRFKMTDGEKAKNLLGDLNNLPVLVIDDRVVLHSLDEVAENEILFEDGNSLAFIYPNTGSMVNPGSQVTIRLGDTAIEPIVSK